MASERVFLWIFPIYKQGKHLVRSGFCLWRNVFFVQAIGASGGHSFAHSQFAVFIFGISFVTGLAVGTCDSLQLLEMQPTTTTRNGGKSFETQKEGIPDMGMRSAEN